MRNPSIVLAGVLVFFVGVAFAAMISFGDAASVAVEYATAERSEDGALRSVIPADVADKLGGIGNAILGFIAVVLANVAGILRVIANLIDSGRELLERLKRRSEPKPIEGSEDYEVDDEDAEMWESQLLRAIDRRDRELTLLAIRKLSGVDYLTPKSVAIYADTIKQPGGMSYDPLTQTEPK
jgi:hypothetical protein